MNRFRFVCVFLCVTGATLFARPHPRPLVYQPLMPASIQPGSPDFIVTVSGANFFSGSVVHWNGSPLPTAFISRSRLQATVPAADVATAGTASVTVVNPAPGGGRSNDIYFPVRVPASTVTMVPGHPRTPGGVSVGDFNSDGHLDVLVSKGTLNTGALNIDTLLGKGDGTFSFLVGGNSPYSAPIAVFPADFNGDGKLDAAVAENFGGGQIYLGNGNGTFTEVPFAGFNGSVAAAADMNRDGNLDIIIVANNFFNNYIQVYPGNGDGTLGNPTLPTLTGLVGSSVAVGDFNGDGKLDFAVPGIVLSPFYKFISVYLGNGDGTVQPAINTLTRDIYSIVTAADVNGDGKLDLVVDGRCVLLGDGNGYFTPGACVHMPAGLFAIATDLGDFNGDGKIDIVALGGFLNTPPFRQKLTIALGNGDGTFQDPIVIDAGVSPPLAYFSGLGVGDFNNDGKLDVAVGSKNQTFVFQQP